MSVALNVRIEEELKERLQERADGLGVSLSAVVQDVLWRDVYGSPPTGAAPEFILKADPLTDHGWAPPNPKRRLTPQGWVDDE